MSKRQSKELIIDSEVTNREYWTKVLKESQESNLNKREFCRQKGIPISAYYYWKKRLSRPIPKKKEPFVEISHIFQNSTLNGKDDVFSFSISKDFHLHVSADLKTILPLIQSIIGRNK